jgi:hypothetical protein
VTAHQAVLDALALRLRESPEDVLPVLRLITSPDALPPVRTEGGVVALARRVNAHRLVERLDAFRAAALSTDEARAALGGVSRQAVSSRVASGTLLALEIGGRSWFPDWQFGESGVLPGLPDVLRVLMRGGRGALAADALARKALPEEGGRSVADLLAAGRVEDAVHYVSTAW